MEEGNPAEALPPLRRPTRRPAAVPSGPTRQWLRTAAQRGTDLTWRLLPFFCPPQRHSTPTGWARAAQQARMQLVALAELRTPLQVHLAGRLPEPWTVAEAERRWAIGQTDMEICGLIDRWACATLPDSLSLGVSPAVLPASGAEARRYLLSTRCAGHAFQSLRTTLAELSTADQAAAPQPRLKTLRLASLVMADMVAELQQVQTPHPSASTLSDIRI